MLLASNRRSGCVGKRGNPISHGIITITISAHIDVAVALCGQASLDERVRDLEDAPLVNVAVVIVPRVLTDQVE